MIVANLQTATSAAANSLPEPVAKNADGIAANGPKIGAEKPMVSKPKAPVAPVKQGATPRQRAAVKTGGPASAKQSAPGKLGTKKLPDTKAAKPNLAAPATQPIAARQGQASQKVGKVKVIRDSVTMPIEDYERIGALKKKCLTMGVAVKKSELLRAGLATLQRLSDEDLKRVVALVETIKTGRPAGKAKKSKDGKKDRKQ